MKKTIFILALNLLAFYTLNAQLCYSVPVESFSELNSTKYGVVSADFNGDWVNDIATISGYKYSVSLMIGNGSGGFATSKLIYDFVSLNPAVIIKADFNKDGAMDLAINFSNWNQISILLGNRFGSFSPPVNFSTKSYNSNPSMTSGDFNNDGNIDIVFSQGSHDSEGFSVLLGNGKGGFIKGSPVNTEGMGMSGNNGVVSKDFNGDGKMDLAISVFGKFSIFFGNGLGSFSFFKSFDSGYVIITQIISEDFNGDNKNDIAISVNGTNVLIMINDGIGNFTTNNNFEALSSAIISSDLNGDGKNDIAISTGSNLGRIQVRYNIGVGKFSDPLYYDTNTTPSLRTIYIICDDFNNDGRIDIATDNYNTNTTSIPNNIKVFLGNISISFSKKNVTCYGGKDGSATATVSCMNPISYSWNTIPIQNTQTAIGLSAGIYSVTVTDAFNAKKSESVSIMDPIPISASFVTTPAGRCSGVPDGSATINVTGGTSPYSYKWDALANNQINKTATNLFPAKYTVVALDSKGCALSKDVVLQSSSNFNSQIYLTNLAAVDQVSVSPSFTAYYSYNLPAKINPNATNLRNFVDPGKKARFKVECTNKKANGQSIVSGICEVRSNSPYITITDNSSALNNIGWNNKAWSADEFEIDIKPDTPAGTIAYIDFIVKENGIEYITSCIPLPITPLNYSPTTSATIDDDSNPDSAGNDNNICEPNEIIEFYPWLDNISTLNAEYVRGRFENLDNLSYINIWNNRAGVGTTVFDTSWWNFAFGQPAVISSNSVNTTPEYDFVFNYNNPDKVNNFKLYMVMAGGFKLFPGTALSLVQWSLPYTFNEGALSTSDFLKDNSLDIYPNPGTTNIKINNSDALLGSFYSIIDISGRVVAKGILATASGIDVSKLSKGVYIIRIGNDFKSKFIKE